MCKDRDQNGLLDEHVDFDTATKVPPQITQETTNQIEALIKQRILDELFDDPIRKEFNMNAKGNDDDFQLQFTKGKGLGDVFHVAYVTSESFCTVAFSNNLIGNFLTAVDFTAGNNNVSALLGQ